MIESIESRIPPRPGIRIPESFTPVDRFSADAMRSPEIVAGATTAARRSARIIDPPKTWGAKKKKAAENPKVPRIPPMKPTVLFFGLIFKGFLAFLPKVMPVIYAMVSLPLTRRRKSKYKRVAFGRKAIRTR